MEQKEFITLIEPLYEFVIGTTKMTDPRGGNTGSNKNRDKQPPEGGGYPVVLASKPQSRECNGASDCQYTKTYSRTPEGWRQYCHECRKHTDFQSIRLNNVNNHKL